MLHKNLKMKKNEVKFLKFSKIITNDKEIWTIFIHFAIWIYEMAIILTIPLMVRIKFTKEKSQD